RILADSKERPDEEQLQALSKGLRALMSGRAEAGTWHTYDAQNRIKTMREVNFAFEKTTEIIYNDQGDRVEERRTVSGNSVMPVGVPFSIEKDGSLTPGEHDVAQPTNPFDPPERSELRYSYQYDDHGNWTERTVTCGLNSDQPSDVRRRKLTYY